MIAKVKWLVKYLVVTFCVLLGAAIWLEGDALFGLTENQTNWLGLTVMIISLAILGLMRREAMVRYDHKVWREANENDRKRRRKDYR